MTTGSIEKVLYMCRSCDCHLSFCTQITTTTIVVNSNPWLSWLPSLRFSKNRKVGQHLLKVLEWTVINRIQTLNTVITWFVRTWIVFLSSKIQPKCSKISNPKKLAWKLQQTLFVLFTIQLNLPWFPDALMSELIHLTLWNHANVVGAIPLVITWQLTLAFLGMFFHLFVVVVLWSLLPASPVFQLCNGSKLP